MKSKLNMKSNFIKSFNKTIAVLMLLSSFMYLESCSKDEGTSTPEQEQVDPAPNDPADPNPAEDNAITITTIDSGVSVMNATKVEGVPPAPSGSVDFQIDSDNHAGYLDTGFLLDVASDDQATGAYIVFKDADDNASSGYFNVSFGADSGKQTLTKRGKSNTRAAKLFEVEEEIVVLFDNSITEGEFCYDICLYNASGDVSQIVTRCLEVSAWGGNEALAGEWLYDRDVVNGEVEEDDDTTTVSCNNGSSIEVSYNNYEKNDWILTLVANGDYNEEYDDIYQIIDHDASAASCDAVYETEKTENHDKYYGKWTYTAANGLSIVDFSYEDFLDPSENETYETGEVYFDGIAAEVINGELVLSETIIDENGDSITYESIFIKNN